MNEDVAAVAMRDDLPSLQQPSPDLVPAVSELARRLGECAMLLDIDGTLLDLAPTPREVLVPPGLSTTLNRPLEKTAGALALLSGRSLNDIDLIFAPDQYPFVSGHVAQLRLTDDRYPGATQPP